MTNITLLQSTSLIEATSLFLVSQVSFPVIPSCIPIYHVEETCGRSKVILLRVTTVIRFYLFMFSSPHQPPPPPHFPLKTLTSTPFHWCFPLYVEFDEWKSFLTIQIGILFYSLWKNSCGAIWSSSIETSVITDQSQHINSTARRRNVKLCNNLSPPARSSYFETLFRQAVPILHKPRRMWGNDNVIGI